MTKVLLPVLAIGIGVGVYFYMERQSAANKDLAAKLNAVDSDASANDPVETTPISDETTEPQQEQEQEVQLAPSSLP